MKLKTEISKGLQLLVRKRVQFKLEERSAVCAAFEEYLHYLETLKYASWYWADRRQVLSTLKDVVEQINKVRNPDALEAICVSASTAHAKATR